MKKKVTEVTITGQSFKGRMFLLMTERDWLV